jgi:hypothetical protein
LKICQVFFADLRKSIVSRRILRLKIEKRLPFDLDEETIDEPGHYSARFIYFIKMYSCFSILFTTRMNFSEFRF